MIYLFVLQVMVLRGYAYFTIKIANKKLSLNNAKY